MKSRIEQTLKEELKRGRKGFIPFITAADPDLESTLKLLLMLADEGASVIELGIPFSDPMADGAVIQRSSDRALKNVFQLEDVFRIIQLFRKERETPLVIFSYLNPIFYYGFESFCRDAKKVGVDGLLVTDLIPEESEDFLSVTKNLGLDMIFLAAPTSSDERLRIIAQKSSGFIYAVSRIGVTGIRENLSQMAKDLVSRIKRFSSLPVAVGFGISRPEHVREVWQFADAAVVGSAIVKKIEETSHMPCMLEEVRDLVRTLLGKGNDRKRGYRGCDFTEPS